MIRTTKLILTLGLLSYLVLSPPQAVSAQTSEAGCILGNRPAATLLFPYFEVDLADPESRTTLLSISNSSTDPALGQVVIWSNCGLPVLDFTVYLQGGGVLSLNMSDVLVAGRLPATWPDDDLAPTPNCSDTILNPRLNEEGIAALRARLLGQPDPGDGLCYATPGEALQLIGYVTVDVLNDCSDTIRTPFEEGYFEKGGTGLASNANVLTGDFFLVDGKGGVAQGFEAVSVVADASHFTGSLQMSFYHQDDDRLPLSSRYRTRILEGGDFSGGTELIVWMNERIYTSGVPCEQSCDGSDVISSGFVAQVRDEQGRFSSSEKVLVQGFVSRLEVGEDVHFKPRFGTMDLGFHVYCGICSPPSHRVQAWVLPIYTAAGRFSVGLNAVRLDDFCD